MAGLWRIPSWRLDQVRISTTPPKRNQYAILLGSIPPYLPLSFHRLPLFLSLSLPSICFFAPNRNGENVSVTLCTPASAVAAPPLRLGFSWRWLSSKSPSRSYLMAGRWLIWCVGGHPFVSGSRDRVVAPNHAPGPVSGRVAASISGTCLPALIFMAFDPFLAGITIPLFRAFMWPSTAPCPWKSHSLGNWRVPGP